jgi:hypothetical protein
VRIGQRDQALADEFGSTASSSSQSSIGGVMPSTSATRSFNVPLLGIGTRRAGIADDGVDRLVAHVEHDIVHRLRIHDVRALLVDHLALVVHHVVVFDDLLADVVVARLDLLLRVLDGLGQPLGPIASPSARLEFIMRANSVSGPKMRSRSSSRQIELGQPGSP